MTRPRLLDLFCCGGGAGVGYSRAGFDVLGVDIVDQPRYPLPFVKADVLDFLANEDVSDFDVIHASPPCQAHSSLRHRTGLTYVDLIPETRDFLQWLGKPYVIENVVGAPLLDPVIYCGSILGLGAFCEDGTWRELRRHRQFESNVSLKAPGCLHEGQAIGVYGNGGGGGTQVKGYKGYINEARDAMGIDWLTQKELSQAIPPAYTEHIGRQLLAAL